MTRNLINFITDLLTALVMLGILGTGLIMGFVLLPGSGHSRLLWGMGRHDWGDVHFWLAVGAVSLLLVHVALHWGWVCTMALRCVRMGRSHGMPPRPLARNLAGISLLLILVGLGWGFVALAQTSVRPTHGSPRAQESQHSGHGQAREDQDSHQGGPRGVQGFMTLADVAQAHGISVDDLKRELQLPAAVSADERIGRLRRQYNFTMDQVRDAAEKLRENRSSSPAGHTGPRP